MGPQVPKDVARDTVRDLSGVVKELAALNGDAHHWLAGPEYAAPRHRSRRIIEYGGARSAQTRAVPGRLEDEREIRQQSRLTRRRSGVGSSCTRVTSNIAGACLG